MPLIFRSRNGSFKEPWIQAAFSFLCGNHRTTVTAAKRHHGELFSGYVALVIVAIAHNT
jgi:hypothetical protein